MKKWTKLFSLAIGALMAIGAAVGVKPTAERVSADSATIATDFGVNTSNSSGITGDWTLSGAVAFGTASENVELNGDSYASVKLLNVKGKYLTYSFDDSYGNVSKVDLDVYAAESAAGTDNFVLSATDKLLQETKNSAVSITNGSFSVYKSSKTSMETDKYLREDSISSVNGIKSIKVQFSSSKNIVLTKIVLTATYSTATYNVNSVSFENDEENLTTGDTLQLNPIFNPENATNKNIQWTSDKESIATVSNTGLVTGISKGDATITATTEDGGKTASCLVHVVDPDLTKYYKKIESDIENWSGKYLICYDVDASNTRVFDGSDKVSNFILATKDSNKIIYKNSFAPYEITISEFNDGYSLKVSASNPTNPNLYLSGTAGSNGLTFDVGQQKTFISFDEEISIINNTAPFAFNSASDQLRFRYFGKSSMKSVSLYKYVDESSVSTLTAPSFTLTNDTINITPVENASSYGVGVFESNTATEPLYSYNVASITYKLPTLPQNTEYYVRVKAYGDNDTYLDSDYSDATAYTNTNIPDCTIEDAMVLEVETEGPFTYYELSGTIVDIDDTYDNNFYLSDGTNKVYVYRLKAEKDSDNDFSLADAGLVEGDTMTIIAYKTKYGNKEEFVGYYVSSEINKKNRYVTEFSSSETMAQLSFTYTAAEETKAYYKKYTSAIAEGDYVICGIDGDKNVRALKNTISNNRFGFEQITVADEKIDSSAIFSNLVWHIEECGDYWTIYNSAVEKYAGGTNSKNEGALIDEVTDLAKWTITKAEGADTYVFLNFGRSKASSNSDKAYLRGNGTYGFATYASTTGQAISLFKLGEAEPSYSYEINKENDKNLISLNFAAAFSASLKKNLDSVGATEYGIAYKYGESGSYNYKAMTGAFVDAAGSSTAIDETLDQAVANKHLFQFRLKLSGIPADNFDVAITAKAYVKIGTDYYFMEEKTHSVNSIASAYLASGDTSISQYEGVLKWLSTYAGD